MIVVVVVVMVMVMVVVVVVVIIQMDGCRRGGGRSALAIDVFESVLGQELVGPFGGVIGVRWACAEGDGEGDFGIVWCDRSGEGKDMFGIRLNIS